MKVRGYSGKNWTFRGFERNFRTLNVSSNIILFTLKL